MDKLHILSLDKHYHTNPILVSDDKLSIWISESDTVGEASCFQ